MPFRNQLLAALPPGIASRLAPRLRQVPLTPRQTIALSEAQADAAWFPETGYVSLMATLPDGKETEVGLVGPEGVVGHPLIFGVENSATEARVRAPGAAWRLGAACFRQLMREECGFRDLMLGYMGAVHEQAMRSAACNGHHGIEKRLARWLLMARDRSEYDVIPVTQEDLGAILCVRRTSITVASQILQRAGIIHYTRGQIRVVDRSALEAAACECYRPPTAAWPRVPLEARAMPGSRLMKSITSTGYRVHFLDSGRRIMAIDVFDAGNDDEALETSAVITGACRDVCSTFELWHGLEMIANERDSIFRRPPGLDELTRLRQQNVCEREQTLRDSFACIRESRTLLASLENLETGVRG